MSGMKEKILAVDTGKSFSEVHSKNTQIRKHYEINAGKFQTILNQFVSIFYISFKKPLITQKVLKMSELSNLTPMA